MTGATARQQDAPGLHPLLARRWSPHAFDSLHTVTEGDVERLLEAARWAPSAGNSQPWSFVAARRGQPDHRRVVRHLAGSAARWAPSASLLVLNLAHRLVDGSELEYSEFAQYDLGQAVAHMTVQASAMGLVVRQLRAFDRAALAAEFGVGPAWEVTTMAAVGVPARDEARAGEHTDRRPLSDLRWPTGPATVPPVPPAVHPHPEKEDR